MAKRKKLGDGIASDVDDDPIGFFEGTEKRIEVDFEGSGDLRKVCREEWDEVVRLSETKILNQKVTDEFVSFLLSESSLLVYPAKVILKTCGRTKPMNSIKKIFAIGSGVGLKPEWLCYSRRNFLAPSEQPEEHQSKETEIALCRELCGGIGDAYVLGPLTGEHWLVYDANFQTPDCSTRGDLTVDIMMYDLPKDVQDVFFTKEPEGSREGALEMTTKSGLGHVAGQISGEVDDYCFSPCGYSCNVHAGKSYFMVHATPQDGCSYASFETNFGSTFGEKPGSSFQAPLNNLVQKVLEDFRPGKFTMTLFVDAGAVAYMGGAPFDTVPKDYKRKATNSYHFEHDYIATMSHYERGTTSPVNSPKK